MPEITNSIQNVRVLHDKIYLITDEPVAEKESSLVRHSPGGSAWEVTAWDPKVYFPNGNESSGSEMLIHENACVRIRPDMPLDRAALLGCAVITGYGAITYTAQVRPGETVAVIGCGGIGLCASNAAALAGAGRIIAIDRIAEKE